MNTQFSPVGIVGRRWWILSRSIRLMRFLSTARLAVFLETTKPNREIGSFVCTTISVSSGLCIRLPVRKIVENIDAGSLLVVGSIC